MKVLDVILTAVKILGDENLYSYLIDENSSLSGYQNDSELLLIAYNQAIISLSMYFPLSFSETLLPTSGTVKYEKFTFNPYKILSVTPKNACSKFKVLPTEILTDSEITVEYNYFVESQDYEDKFPYENGVVNSTTISYGIISEYLLYKGRYDESVAYNDKFVTSLKNLANYKKKKKIKSREWF
ncbi:MAG: hypothetical protein E7358_02065 [Clostridiales bacterium]|jgi:hypothetical protein|nr:hypothetical protein [Clostridiales bacterium]